MTEMAQIAFLIGLIGLLIVWTPPPLPQGPKPKPGDDVCDFCGRALLTMHDHGVRVFPRPKGPPPKGIPGPPR
jgi:hypothetical protein